MASPKIRWRVKKAGIAFFILLVFVLIGAGALFFFPRTEMLQGILPERFFKDAITKDAAEIDSMCVSGVVQNDPRWFNCYRDEFERLTKVHTLDYVFKVLNALQTINPKLQECHIIAHGIMEMEVAKNPRGWQTLLGRLNENYCDFGFLHGVIEGRMRFDPNFSVNERTIPDVCRITKTIIKNPTSLYSCVHAMGHILLAQERADIPRALEVCRKVPQDMWFNCSAGVFMEDITRINLGIHLDIPPFPWNEEWAAFLEQRCGTYHGIEGKACWMEMAHVYTELFPDDPGANFTRCTKKAPGAEEGDICYWHAVAQLAIINQNKGEPFLAILCSPYAADREKFSRCSYLVTEALVNDSINLTKLAIAYCANVPEGFRGECYAHIGEFLTMLVPEKKQRALCDTAPIEYRARCAERGEAADGFVSETITSWRNGISTIREFLQGFL